MLGAHALKGWSKTQALIALSSGESELYAALKASAETLGLVSILGDLGYNVSGELWGDASAALAIIYRRGLGKTRHIETGSCGYNKRRLRRDSNTARLSAKKIQPTYIPSIWTQPRATSIPKGWDTRTWQAEQQKHQTYN